MEKSLQDKSLDCQQQDMFQYMESLNQFSYGNEANQITLDDDQLPFNNTTYISNESRKSDGNPFTNENQDQDSFLQNFLNTSSTKNNVGVSILQNDGSFLLADGMTKKILEIQDDIVQNKLLNQCAQAGESNLKKLFQKECILLQGQEVEKEFQMTIYSQKNLKKSQRYLNQYYKEGKLSLQKMNLNSASQKLFQRQHKQLQKFDNLDKIKIIYLKTITIKLTKKKLIVTKEFLKLNQKYPEIYISQQLSMMAENQTQQYLVMKCEISENLLDEKLLQVDIEQDYRVKTLEDKRQKKIQLMKQDLVETKKELSKRLLDGFPEQQNDLSSAVYIK